MSTPTCSLQAESRRFVTGPTLPSPTGRPLNFVAGMMQYGVLVKKTLGMRPYSGMRAYEDIQESVIDAATDPNVRGILLDIDSPGGDASGLPDLGDALVEAASLKPMWAAANDDAYSAAYWIAATAERIYTTRTSGIGSVGVIMVHWEMSKALEGAGYAVRVFRFGEHKAEVNRLEPLTEHAIETFLLSGLDGQAPERLELTFYDRLRDEKRFGSTEELREQILADAARAERFFRRLEAEGRKAPVSRSN